MNLAEIFTDKNKIHHDFLDACASDDIKLTKILNNFCFLSTLGTNSLIRFYQSKLVKLNLIESATLITGLCLTIENQNKKNFNILINHPLYQRLNEKKFDSFYLVKIVYSGDKKKCYNNLFGDPTYIPLSCVAANIDPYFLNKLKDKKLFLHPDIILKAILHCSQIYQINPDVNSKTNILIELLKLNTTNKINKHLICNLAQDAISNEKTEIISQLINNNILTIENIQNAFEKKIINNVDLNIDEKTTNFIKTLTHLIYKNNTDALNKNFSNLKNIYENTSQHKNTALKIFIDECFRYELLNKLENCIHNESEKNTIKKNKI